MARSIDDILNEADALINSRSQEKVAAAAPVLDDDVTSLARLLSMDAPATVKTAQPEIFEMNLNEKVAHALAITDTLTHIEELMKIASFEEAARERGIPQDQIDKFISEKLAFNSASKHVIPAAVAGVAGYAVGSKKGKEKGYNKALDDVSSAFSQGQ
jgi:hypothetical protein